MMDFRIIFRKRFEMRPNLVGGSSEPLVAPILLLSRTTSTNEHEIIVSSSCTNIVIDQIYHDKALNTDSNWVCTK